MVSVRVWPRGILAPWKRWDHGFLYQYDWGGFTKYHGKFFLKLYPPSQSKTCPLFICKMLLHAIYRYQARRDRESLGSVDPSFSAIGPKESRHPEFPNKIYSMKIGPTFAKLQAFKVEPPIFYIRSPPFPWLVMGLFIDLQNLCAIYWPAKCLCYSLTCKMYQMFITLHVLIE